jgi:hypothetical protein
MPTCRNKQLEVTKFRNQWVAETTILKLLKLIAYSWFIFDELRLCLTERSRVKFHYTFLGNGVDK